MQSSWEFGCEAIPAIRSATAGSTVAKVSGCPPTTQVNVRWLDRSLIVEKREVSAEAGQALGGLARGALLHVSDNCELCSWSQGSNFRPLFVDNCRVRHNGSDSRTVQIRVCCIA